MALPDARRVLTAGLVAGGIVVLPFAGGDAGHGTAALAATATAVVLLDLLVAALLATRFLARGSALPLLLGSTFLVAALVSAAHALVLPGLGTDGAALVAAGHAAEWLWLVVHAGLPAGAALAVWGGPAALRRALAAPTLRRPAALATAGAGTVAAVTALCVAAILAGDRLPAEVELSGGEAATALGAVSAGVVALASLGLLVLVARRARRSELERRLPVVIGCLLAGTLLTLVGGGRFTVGWYASAFLEVAAAAVVLATLLADPVHLGRAGAADARADVRDPLTGIASRAAALVAAEHLHRTRAPGAPIALVLIDVDALRAIEDAHGALAADAVLVTVADRLRSELRDEDVLARAGDEGFLILLPETDVDGATLVADRALAAIRDQPLGTWAHDVRTTASGGVAMIGDGPGAVAQALDAADLALNQAKAHGRDQVVSPGRALVVPLRRAAAGSQPG